MNTQKTPNPKCSSCLCYWKPVETDIKSSGLPYKTCVKCRDNAQAYRDRLNTIPFTDEGLMNNYQARYNRKKYQDNKDYFREIMKCPCGSDVSRDNIHKHIKTLKHREFISKN